MEFEGKSFEIFEMEAGIIPNIDELFVNETIEMDRLGIQPT